MRLAVVWGFQLVKSTSMLRGMKSSSQFSKSRISRRSFLISSAAAVSTVTILPRQVLGGTGQSSPSSKLNLAVIGAGGRGAADLEDLKSENIVALCDVDWDSAAKTFARFPKAIQYRDFRVMLEKNRKSVV